MKTETICKECKTHRIRPDVSERNRNNKYSLGRKFSEEHRRKISEAKKLNNPASFKKGHIVDEKTRIKIGLGNKGIKHTEEFCKNISKRLKGKPAWNKGKKLSKEHKRKLRLSHLGKKINNCKRLTEMQKIIRSSFNYRQWRSDVFTRDNYTCQNCYKKGGDLQAHHIKSFALILKENNIKNIEDAYKCMELWNLNNGTTLCKKCHKLTDNYGYLA